MRFKQSLQIVTSIIAICAHSKIAVCNPIAFDPTSAPMIALPPMPLQAPMFMGPQYDPFMGMHGPAQFYLGQQFGPMPSDTNRRSHSGGKNSQKSTDESDDIDEQKALGDLPVSFIEPEGPSTVSERISDSFSAIGEGVRNHFRSLTENFSDTMDDIKDAWRSSDSQSSKKRG